jgi:hypothetical protein
MINVLNQPWLGTAFTILGTVLTVYGTIAIIKAKIGVRLNAIMTASVVVAKRDDRIQILYDGKPVQRVISNTITIWNSGSRTIAKSQVVDTDRLRISVDRGSRILSTEILRTTRSVNAFTLSIESVSPSTAQITFEFLDPRDGATVRILHDGKDDYATISGTVMGMPKGIRLVQEDHRPTLYLISLVIMLVLLALSMVILNTQTVPQYIPLIAIVVLSIFSFFNKASFYRPKCPQALRISPPDRPVKKTRAATK